MTEEEIRKIVDQMTLEEKASLASGEDFWRTKPIDRLGVPPVYLSDGPHGLRKQEAAADQLGLNESVKSTCFPTAVTMAAGWDTDTCHTMGEALGKEAAALKVGILLGPGVNIKRSPLCGRNFEYYSEDPYLAGKMASALISGIQEHTASACVKHFACNNQETGRMYVDSIVDERALREIYLEPFEMAVKEAHVNSIMTSYNLLNGTYTNENEHLLVDILRNDWGYEGLVVTDWGGCNDRVAGYKCRNELEMPTTSGESNEEIVKAVKDGALDEAVVNQNAENLLKLVFKSGEYFEEGKSYDKDEHHLIAKRAATGSEVLLKNDGALPLRDNEKVCFIGDFAETARYQGGGSSCVNPTRLDTLKDLAKTLNEDQNIPVQYIGWEKGFDQYGKKSKKNIKKAVALAGKADKVVLFMGLDDVTESEGKDRADMKIPENQLMLLDALTAVGKPIVVVLSCGSPVETDWDEKVNALLCVYLTGQAGAQAILDNLTGVANPSGKLPETFPLKLEDNPTYNTWLKNDNTSEYRESIYVGYRYYDKAGIEVKYPFGYGLSYTTFGYSDLEITPEGVSFTLTNTGKVAGAEVAQLYIGAKDSKVFRAVRELKGFKKVFLQPGESRKVEIPFETYSFRWFNVKTNRFEIEDCDYNIEIGSSSRDIRLAGTFHPEGGVAVDTDYDETFLAEYYSGDIASVEKETFETLVGRELPSGKLNYYKKKRLIVDMNTSITQMKHARGWVGRLFGGAIIFAEGFLRKIGKRKLANLLKIGVYYMPIRGLFGFTGGMFSKGQLQGFLLMFNGHFFRGLSEFCRYGRVRKLKRKAVKAAAALDEAKKANEEKQDAASKKALDKAGKKCVKATGKAAKKAAKAQAIDEKYAAKVAAKEAKKAAKKAAKEGN
ncbi:MAG: glycoside hydrolase family 3 C-terminal domain-containing protein [Clostridia bacterium]|nr:glycoside hydrolase family 3 C-terminal domain-containing protein [Clostridia bacterium]